MIFLDTLKKSRSLQNLVSPQLIICTAQVQVYNIQARFAITLCAVHFLNGHDQSKLKSGVLFYYDNLLDIKKCRWLILLQIHLGLYDWLDWKDILKHNSAICSDSYCSQERLRSPWLAPTNLL